MAKGLPRYRDYDDDPPQRGWADEEYYQQRRPTRGNGPAWVMVGLMLIGVVAFVGYILVDMFPRGGGETQPARIGNQAPPNVISRGGAPAQAAPVINPNVAGNEATAQAMYSAAVVGQQVATPAPLPLNSAGQPIITAEQQRQQALSLQLAEQEGNAAADRALQAQRNASYADAAARPPDVSAADGAMMMGRPLCSVPRADPHTCDKGLFKPTPVN